MAKRAARRERFVNRYRAGLTFSADASVVKTDSFQTGMNVGHQSNYKWIVLGFDIMPTKAKTGPASLAMANFYFHFQLLQGTHTDFENDSDPQVIAGGRIEGTLATQGGQMAAFPLAAAIRYPLPVFANTLTVAMQSIDSANVNSSPWTYTVWYVTAPVTPVEITEYMAAYGSL